MIFYEQDGNTLLEVEVDDNSYRYREIMGDNTLTLYFSLADHVEIPLGAYVDFQGERYTLQRPEALKMNHTRNFEYTVTLESDQAKAKIWKFRCLYSNEKRGLSDGRLKFSLTATPREHLQMFVDNMNRRDTGWTIGSCIDDVEKCISYDHAYCWTALSQMADEFNTEFEIVGKTVSLHKVEYNKDTPLPLSYGRGNGFKTGVSRENYEDTPPIEILYTQGGTENIDNTKYGSSELLLPKNGTIAYDGEKFEDEEGFDETNAHTYIADDKGFSIYRLDGTRTSLAEDSLDCSSIYPQRVGTISEVVCVNEDSNFYDFIDTSIPDSLDFNDCLIEGENMSVTFQSGMLAGRDFDVKYYHDAKSDKKSRRFEIVPQIIDSQTMPNETFKPAQGDKYAIFGCYLPDAYINAYQKTGDPKTGAEWDMMRQAVKYLYDNEVQNFSFTGTLDGIFAKKNWINIGGKLRLGGYILFTDDRFQKEGVRIRIINIKDYINTPYSPEIELSNSTVSGSFSSAIKEIESSEVIAEEQYKDAIQFTKRRFRDAQETLSMIEEALLDNFSNSINPITVQTMAMLVGDESLQFRFVNSKTTPQQVACNITYDQTAKILHCPSGIIQHMTLGIDSVSPTHDVSEYRFWNMAEFTSGRLEDGTIKYYLYARVSKLPSKISDTFYLSPTAIKMETPSDRFNYYLLVGVLNSEYDGERSFATLYGFTEVLPGRITTDRIVSSEGDSYFDLVGNAMKLGDALDFNGTGDGTLRLKGTIVQSLSGESNYLGCYRGVFNIAYTYYNGDEVTYAIGNCTSTYRYIFETPAKGILPTNTDYWQVTAQGEKGKDGNGVEYVFKRTEVETAPTISSAISEVDEYVPDGWTADPSGVTEEYPVEWVSSRRKTNGAWGAFSEPTLWNNYAVWSPNLLEQTEFESMDRMDKWSTVSLYPSSGQDNNIAHIVPDGVDGHNYFYDENEKQASEEVYKEVLQQRLYCSSTANKLKPSTWYTLSFWEQCGSVCDYSETIFYVYVYPNAIDNSKVFVDGVQRTDIWTDCAVGFTPNYSWKKHTITFKTKSSFGSEVSLLFRLMPVKNAGDAYFLSICMPKLEIGKVATSYSRNTNDNRSDYQECRFAKNGSTSTAPSLVNTSIEPSGWTTIQPSVGALEYLWMTVAKKSGTGALLEKWSDPVRITPYDGENGENGKSPVMVYRGTYLASKTYYGNEYRCDCVSLNGAYYIARIDAGEFNSVTPPNTTKWNAFGASFESVATNLLLANLANIAGFIFRNGRLESQTLADGTVTDGESSLTPMVFMNGNTGQVSFAGGKALFNADGSVNIGNGKFTIDTSGNAVMNNVTMNNITANSGTFKGLIYANNGIVFGTRTITQNYQTLSTADAFVLVDYHPGSTADWCYLLLPASPNVGQIITVKNFYTIGESLRVNLFLDGNGHVVYPGNDSPGASAWSSCLGGKYGKIPPGYIGQFIFDGTNWHQVAGLLYD